MEVSTVLPSHSTSRGSPTLSDTTFKRPSLRDWGLTLAGFEVAARPPHLQSQAEFDADFGGVQRTRNARREDLSMGEQIEHEGKGGVDGGREKVAMGGVE